MFSLSAGWFRKRVFLSLFRKYRFIEFIRGLNLTIKSSFFFSKKNLMNLFVLFFLTLWPEKPNQILNTTHEFFHKFFMIFYFPFHKKAEKQKKMISRAPLSCGRILMTLRFGFISVRNFTFHSKNYSCFYHVFIKREATAAGTATITANLLTLMIILLLSSMCVVCIHLFHSSHIISTFRWIENSFSFFFRRIFSELFFLSFYFCSLQVDTWMNWIWVCREKSFRI